jgi:hypothetical protein
MATQRNSAAKAKTVSSRTQKHPKRKAPSARAKLATKRTAQAKSRVLKPSQPADSSKQSRLITMLRSEPGATIDQMVKLTGWQPHTVRATISSALRKRLGLNIAASASSEGRSRVYRIVDAP